MYTTTDDGQERGTMAKGRVGKHGKTRGRVAGSKNKRQAPWSEQHAVISGRADIGSIEQWGRKIGVERIEEADTTRRKTVSFAMLAIRDRAIDAGGRVTVAAAVDEMEHTVLDPVLRAGVLDDPANPERAAKRHEAGLELLRLAIAGRIPARSTASWSAAAGSGGGGGVTEADATSKAALAEMRFYNARDAVGPDLWPKIRSICLDMEVLHGTKRSQMLAGLDVLAEYLLNFDTPPGFVRPKTIFRDRTIPEALRAKMNRSN